MILAIDAGNTRIKWGFHEDNGWLSVGAVNYSEVSSLQGIWADFGVPEKVMVSNVAGAVIGQEISVLLSMWDCVPVFVSTKAFECGVHNGYRDFTQLGVDRWCALIAARELHSGYCLVVNAGTAMTVDAMIESGEFIGGIIVPGLQLMQDSLVSATAGIRVDVNNLFLLFPNNTASALYSGALQALAGAIERMHAAVADAYGVEPKCILSGGSATPLKAMLNMPLQVVDNLVLEGLIRIARQ